MDKIKLPIESDEGLSGEQVVKNSLNNSTSKQQFSFPKALRFIHNKTLQDTREYYDPPSTRSTKAATIGQS